MHVLGSGIVSNTDVERKDPVRGLWKLQGDPHPSLSTRSEILFTKQEACRQNESGAKGRGGGGRVWGGQGAGGELLAPA